MKYSNSSKDEVFAKLRREILAARLKVTMDEQLNRETSSTVARQSEMRLPPFRRPHYRMERDQTDAVVQKPAGIGPEVERHGNSG